VSTPARALSRASESPADGRASEPALVVVAHRRDFPWTVPGVRVSSAHDYLAGDVKSRERRPAVINLCRFDRYQSRGYYVSLLAEARGQAPLPEMRVLGDVQRGVPVALGHDEFVARLQLHLSDRRAPLFTLDVVLGRDARRGYDALAADLFARVPAPLLRVTFLRTRGRWHVARIRALNVMDVCRKRPALLLDGIRAYLAARQPSVRGPLTTRRLAILHNEDEPDPPSNREALARFRRVGASLGMHVEVLGRRDAHRLPEFGGLFIRDTTNVEHYTYEFACRAAEAGLVVIDDPQSILKCTNKVYLHELFERHQVPAPRTMLVHRGNADDVAATLGLPCVLKQPDSAFSLGVFKVETAEALRDALSRLLKKSDLVLAQEWLPTTFDWRVGVLDRRALYVCKYFMAPGHWQVVKREAQRKVEGSTATLAVADAPPAVVETALKAANLIGDGLYGVDVKEANGKCYVMEVNDNPNIDAGNEDAIARDALYREILGTFLRRMRTRARPAAA